MVARGEGIGGMGKKGKDVLSYRIFMGMGNIVNNM